MKNRLNLDFNLETTEERSAYITQYFTTHSSWEFTPAELETCANYILWGKNSDGLNARQTHEIQLETRHKTWDAKPVESLEALQESPTFAESSLLPLNGPQYKAPKVTFSRNKTRQTAPPELLETFEALWRQIDSLELELNFYELNHNKRSKPPRDTLLAKFTQSQIDSIKFASLDLNQSTYLKKRHLLVELRRDQYGYKDLFVSPLQKSDFEWFQEYDAPVVTDAYPVGLNHDETIDRKVFPTGRWPIPQDFTEKDLELVYILLWREITTPLVFDFRDLESVYQLLGFLEEVNDYTPSFESELHSLTHTLEYYIERADLNEAHREILALKISHQKNIDIADYINHKYNKSYNANYISTLFRQKIIPSINEAARIHREVLENIFYPENFQVCRCCGQTLLMSPSFFVRKQKSKTGYTSRCKKCDRLTRQST